MKPQIWIIIVSAAAILVGISAFVSTGNSESERTVRNWEELSFAEKTISKAGLGALNVEDYKKWYSENKKKFVVSETIGKIKYSITYMPQEVLVLKELASNKEMKAKEALEIYSEQECYVFTFEDTSGSTNPFSKKGTDHVDPQIQNFMSFDMQQYLSLISGNDTIPCSLFHYERMIGFSPRFQFICTFNLKDKKKENQTVLFQDILFNQGTVKLHMSAEQLNLSPEVIIK